MEKLEDEVTEQIPLHVYFFDDGENHWIIALNEEQARDYFENEYNPDFDKEEGYEVEKVSGAILTKKIILDGEDSKEKLISLKEIVERTKDQEIQRVLASSVY